jgi:hypothetical protein
MNPVNQISREETSRHNATRAMEIMSSESSTFVVLGLNKRTHKHKNWRDRLRPIFVFLCGAHAGMGGAPRHEL